MIFDILVWVCLIAVGGAILYILAQYAENMTR